LWFEEAELKMELQWPAGLKRTKPREQIWKILAETDHPMEVQEIYRRMEPEEGSLAMSTVYRALAAFEEHGIVTKTTMMGGETAVYRLRRSDHEHYAICLRCHRQVPLKECPFEHMPVQTESDGFLVTGHRLELYGYCEQCRSQEMAEPVVDAEEHGWKNGK
jgi:Fe2+ or Zn2+ uptake regulation protein